MDPIPPTLHDDLRIKEANNISSVSFHIPKFRHFGRRAIRLLNEDFVPTSRFVLKTRSSDALKLSFTLQRDVTHSLSHRTSSSTSTTAREIPRPITLIVTPEFRFNNNSFRLKANLDVLRNAIPKIHFSARDFLHKGLKVVYRSLRTEDHNNYGAELQYRFGRGNAVVGLDFEEGRGARLTLSSVLGFTGRRIIDVGGRPDYSLGAEVRCTVPDSVSSNSTIESVLIGANYVSHLFDLSGTRESVWNGKPYNSKYNLQLLYRFSDTTAFASNITVQDPDVRNFRLTGQASIELGVKHRYSDSTSAKARLNTQTGVVGVTVNHKLSKTVDLAVSSEFHAVGSSPIASPLNVFGLSFTFSP